MRTIKCLLVIGLIGTLVGCAGNIVVKMPKTTDAPRRHYIPDSEVIYKTETTFAGRDADFLLTADAIYVMYDKNYAYLNPAYRCHYKNFPYEPVLQDDTIKIDCRGGHEGVRYFQFIDRPTAKTAYEKISAVRSGAFTTLKHHDLSKTDHISTKPPSHFQVTEDVIYRTKTSHGSVDKEFVVTELGVYVLYGGNDVHLDPAYECLYKDFLRMPIEKQGSIGITCVKDRSLYTLNYFQIYDSNDRAIAVDRISDHVPDKTDMAWNDAYRNKQLLIAEELFKMTGVTSSETCIPDEVIKSADERVKDSQMGPNVVFDPTSADKGVKDGQMGPNAVFDPRMVLHPEIAGYIVANPALLAGVLFGGVFVDIENLSQGWETKREEKRRKKQEKRQKEELRKKALDPRKETPQIGSSSELSLALAVTADSILKNKVAYIAKLCDLSEDEIGSYTSPHTDLSDSFSTVVEITEYSGELLKHDDPRYEGLDTELNITAIYQVVDTKSGNIIITGKVKYVDLEPLNVMNRNEITVDMIEGVMQVAYRDVAELIIDSILNNTSKH